MKPVVKLCNNHTLFVEGAVDRETAAQILSEMTDDTPLGLMFRQSGTLLIPTSEHTAINVPYRQIRLTDRHITCSNLSLAHEGHYLKGVGISVPSDAMGLHCAWEAYKNGVKDYKWATFLTKYAEDLAEVGALLFDHVDTCRIDGMMAQVITSPLIGYDEVGVNADTMRKLHKRLSKTHDELKDVKTLEGMWVLLQRQPVVGPKGGRWVKLVLVNDAPSDKLLVHAGAWKKEHGGDEDGDGGYIGIGKNALFGDVSAEMLVPQLTVIENEGMPERRESDPVMTVMGFLARELTGPQHTLFHGLARASAVKVASLADTYEEKAKVIHRATCKVFDIYYPLAEGTFDVRKNEEGITAFRDIVRENENHLKGGRVDETVFFPLLDDKQRVRFTKMMEVVGHSTSIAKGTIFGRLLMDGDSRRVSNFGFLTEAMAKAGVEPLDMIKALQADALGEKFQPLELPKPRKPKKKRTETTLRMGTINNLKDVFENLNLDGKSILKVLGMEENEDGTTTVRVRLMPIWKNGADCPVFTVLIPRIEKVDGSPHTKHRMLRVPGMSPRMFCPIFRIEDGEVQEIGIKLWFSRVIKLAIEAFAKRMGRVTKEKIQDHMDRAVRKAVRDLVMIHQNSEEQITDEGLREMMVRMFEWRVEVEDDRTISGKWNRLEEILDMLSTMGYDICTTSKNKPGTIVTKGWKNNIPRFLWAVNPFAADLDMKRRVEIREIRKALELAEPMLPAIKTKGCKVPTSLLQCMTMLNVAAVDIENWNMWVDGEGKPWGFDTLLVTASGVDKLAVKKLGFHAEDKEEANRIVKKLLANGFTDEQIKVQELVEDLGDGLMALTYDIVAMGPVLDIGKIKAAVGPIKGVMNPVNFTVYSVDAEGNRTEIDIIVPHDTVVRKRALDAVKYMMAAKAGVTEVDPDNEPVIEVVKEQLIAVLEDGTEVDLGMRLTGPLPFYRPVQTGRSTCDIRMGEDGVKVNYHTMIMAKRFDEMGRGVDRIRFNTPSWVSEDFAQIVTTRKAVLQELAAITGMGDEEEVMAEVVERVEALANVKTAASALPVDENDPFAAIGN